MTPRPRQRAAAASKNRPTKKKEPPAVASPTREQEAELAELSEVARKLVSASNRAGEALEGEIKAERASAKLLGRIKAQSLLKHELELRSDLAEAALALADGLSVAEQNEALWASAGQSAAALELEPLSTRDSLTIAEFLNQSLPVVLTELGYQKPPPADHWVRQVQDPIRLMVEGDLGAAATRTALAARDELRYFVLRLRQLAQRALEDEQPPPDSGGSSRSRTMLSQGIRIAREKAIPTAIGAAAASGLLFQLSLSHDGPWVGVVGAAGAGALIKTGVENAMVLVLARRAPELGLSSGEILEQGLRRCVLHLDDLTAAYDDLGPGQEPPDLSVNVALVRHDLFALLAATSDLAESAAIQRHALEALEHLELPPPPIFFDAISQLLELAKQM